MITLYRLSAALFCWFVLIGNAYYFHDASFRFFTDLGWLGITLYFTLAMIPLDRIQPLYHYLKATVLTFPWIVTLVFWSLLYQDFLGANLLGRFFLGAPHSLNLILILTELVFGNDRLERNEVVYPLVTIYLYLAYSAVWKVTGTPWPYSFMDDLFASEWWIIVLTFFGLSVAVGIAFSLSYGLIHCRESFRSKKSQANPLNSSDELLSPQETV